MFGFSNPTNTVCYLNAALQAALHCPQLTNYFLKKLHVADLNKRRKGAAALTQAYADLVDAYWTGTSTDAQVEAAAAQTRDAFLKMHKRFANDRQHDAHEALSALFKTLHESLSKTKRIPGSKAEQALASSAPDALAAWHAHNEGDYSILSEIFQTQVRADVAGDDGYANVTYEHAMDLAVPLRDTLIEGLDAFLATETLPYRTDDGRDISIVRTQRITVLPLILIVQLLRFGQDGKTNTFIDYPLELDMRRYTGRTEDVYALFGAILHGGGDALAGHYTAMCKGRDESWVIYNDEHVGPLNHINDCVNKNAYVLLYKRIAP